MPLQFNYITRKILCQIAHDRIRNFYDSELIKVITGIRRCGKSVLMNQIIEEIKQNNVDDEHIIYINFEDYDFIDYTEPHKFNNYIKEKIIDKKNTIYSLMKFKTLMNSKE